MRRLNARSSAFDPKSKMDSSKLQFRPSTSSSRFSLLSRLSSPPNPKQPNTGGIWIAISVLAAVFAVLFLFFALRSDGNRRFGIIIDGGSTGTRIHVYAYVRGRGMVPVMVDLGSSATMKVNPGLSSFADDPEKAGESLVELLEFGRRRIPRDLWQDTDIRLMATAGLRLLDAVVQEKILESCRRVLRISGFRFNRDWASVITGSNEGIYAWITANYALGTLGNDPERTTGIIELGGASAQITFVSSEPVPPKFSHVLRFGEVTYNLYSHSFLHLGQNVAYESHLKSFDSGNMKSTELKVFHEENAKDPCTPRGYVHAQESRLDSKSGYLPGMHSAGNFSECRSAALVLLQKGKDKCEYKKCHMGLAFVPELKGRFLATENFYYTSKFLGLHSTSFLSNMVMAGERFCNEDWSSLKKKHGFLSEEDLVRYCFSSAYIVAMLHDSLGIALEDDRVRFVNQVGGIPLDWSLGAFVMERMSNLNAERPHSATNFVSDNLSALLSVLMVFALIFTVWSVSRWRKPQVKTIYDLEKGRYIVTRISP